MAGGEKCRCKKQAKLKENAKDGGCLSVCKLQCGSHFRCRGHATVTVKPEVKVSVRRQRGFENFKFKLESLQLQWSALH